MPPPRGEEMTDSPYGLSTSRDTWRWSTQPAPPREHPGAAQPPFSALNSVRHAASTSRTYGRFAVDPFGPIPDPDALLDAAQ